MVKKLQGNVVRSGRLSLKPAAKSPPSNPRDLAELKKARKTRIKVTPDPRTLKAEGTRATHGLYALAELGSQILEIRDSADNIMQDITIKARLLLGCDISYIVEVYEPDVSGRVVASSGLSDRFPRHFAKVNFGLVGLTFREKKPIVCLDYETDPRSPEWLIPYVKGEGMKSILEVPLLIEDKVAGILVLSNCWTRQFSKHDVRLATTFANLASIALKNSATYKEQKIMLRQLELLNESLSKRNTEIQNTRHIHDQFMTVALESGGIPMIAHTLVKIIHNPVLVEDRYGEILAFVSDENGDDDDISPRTISELSIVNIARLNPAVKGQLKYLEGNVKQIQATSIETPGVSSGQGRLIAPIIAGDQLLGYVSGLVNGDSQSDLTDRVAIEYAAMALALEILKQRNVFEAEQRAMGDFLSSLLSGDLSQTKHIFQRASYLGYNLAGPKRLMVMKLDKPINTESDELIDVKQSTLNRLLHAVIDSIATFAPDSFATVLNQNIVVLVAIENPDQEFWLTSTSGRLAEDMKEAIKRINPELTASVGVGCLCLDHKEYKKSYDEARRALDIAGWMGYRDEVISLQNFGIVGLLFDPQNLERLSVFAERYLNPLIAYDNDHDTNLIKTLLTYLDSNCSPKICGDLLFIHENTVRHRLERIENLCKVDLRSADTRLSLQLALKIHSLQPVGPRETFTHN